MPDLPVSETQLERIEAIREELEAAYVGEYGTVRHTDAIEYLLDTYTPPDGEAGGTPDIGALTEIDGVGEATAASLAEAGFGSVRRVADADPDAIAELQGVSREQAVDIAASAASVDADGVDTGTEDGDDTAADDTAPSGSDDSPEDTLQRAMSLLDAHEDRWRESGGDEPYEVDLPDGSTTGVRTKDDVKRLLFKHWR